MVHKTKGIVLRTIKYGETSIICTVFTEKLGLQSYMVKGVRSARSSKQKASILFPSSILHMVVYQQPQRNLNVVKEYYPAVIYQTIQEEVLKNCVALFTVEVIHQLLVSGDPQPGLFSFLEQYLLQLDAAYTNQVANFPLFLLIQSGKLSGYYIAGSYSDKTPFADVHEGRFTSDPSAFPPLVSNQEAQLMSQLNKADSIDEIISIKMNGRERQAMLQYYLTFIQVHVPHFRTLKSLPVLISILY